MTKRIFNIRFKLKYDHLLSIAAIIISLVTLLYTRKAIINEEASIEIKIRTNNTIIKDTETNKNYVLYLHRILIQNNGGKDVSLIGIKNNKNFSLLSNVTDENNIINLRKYILKLVIAEKFIDYTKINNDFRDFKIISFDELSNINLKIPKAEVKILSFGIIADKSLRESPNEIMHNFTLNFTHNIKRIYLLTEKRGKGINLQKDN